MAPRFGLSVVTLGVSDVARSVRFYEALGLVRKMKETGDQIAFFDAGNVIVALFRWDDLAADAMLPAQPRPQAFRGMTLACNCRSEAEVDAVLAHALSIGGCYSSRHREPTTVVTAVISPILMVIRGKQ
jgi:catechol 2,3-dioxygenase-like lactoylglutathione lyase family enzyme